MKTQTFGTEIEMTGITRERAAEVIAEYFGTTSRCVGGGYRTYAATDRKGRTWKAMYDSSIVAYKKVNGRKVSAGEDYKTEMVTPILTYDDMEDLQEIIRHLRKAGAMVNTSCGYTSTSGQNVLHRRP